VKARHDVLVLEGVLEEVLDDDGVDVVEVEGGKRQSLLKQEVPKNQNFSNFVKMFFFRSWLRK
jgi:hypothetical protein